MKQGWIQVQNNGAQEMLAPKTLATMVYMDETQEKTVSDALSDGFIAEYTHAMTTTDDARIHNFTGPIHYTGMGRAWISEEISEGDVVQINGQNVDVFTCSEGQGVAPKDCWGFFVIDESGMHFGVMGGSQLGASGISDFSYSGECVKLMDEKVDGVQNWRIKFITSGILTFSKNMVVDAFLVGGGGAGGAEIGGADGNSGGGGGGGGCTVCETVYISRNEPYAIEIGSGGVNENGGDTKAFGLIANGGTAANNGYGGSGGSGGGGGGYYNLSQRAQNGGSDGGSGGNNAGAWHGGDGQGTTTREFHEENGTLYAGGGGGGAYEGGGAGNAGDDSAGAGGSNAPANRGGGGGGANGGNGARGNGGSGVVIIRNTRG